VHHGDLPRDLPHQLHVVVTNVLEQQENMQVYPKRQHQTKNSYEQLHSLGPTSTVYLLCPQSTAMSSGRYSHYSESQPGSTHPKHLQLWLWIRAAE